MAEIIKLKMASGFKYKINFKIPRFIHMTLLLIWLPGFLKKSKKAIVLPKKLVNKKVYYK